MNRRLLLVPVVAALFALPAVAREDAIARSTDAAIEKIGKEARVSALAKVVGSGEVLYARAETEALVPASTMKLATTGAAVEVLGPEFQHETRVFARGKIEGDVLQGDIVIRGSGDPTISRRFDGDSPLDEWATMIGKRVRRVTGDVVADDRAFERLAVHPEWNVHDLEEWYGAEVSALSLNDDCVEVETKAEGSTVHARVLPETSFVRLDVHATVTSSGDHRISYVRDLSGEDNVIKVDGAVRAKSAPFTASVPVRNPALFFATVLRERLAAAGVKVEGKARLVAPDEAQPSGETLYRRLAPLARTLAICNKKSQNFYAECIQKTIGRATSSEGSWTSGSKAVEGVLDKLGVPASERRVHDGSGLSREDRLSARALVTVLEKVAAGPNGEILRASLSVAGEDGTLEKRLKGLPPGVVVRGKTGTMHGVSSLAGLVELEREHGAHETIAFSMIVNGTRGAAAARAAQDELVRAIVRARTRSRAE